MCLVKAAVPLANIINELMKVKIEQPMSESLLVYLNNQPQMHLHFWVLPIRISSKLAEMILSLHYLENIDN